MYNELRNILCLKRRAFLIFLMVTWGAREGTEVNGEHSPPTNVAQTPGIQVPCVA